jgi:hypothetical protein
MWAKKWLLGRDRFTHLNLLNFIRNDSPEDYKNYLRMSDENVQYLIAKLLPCWNNLRCEPPTEPAFHGTLLKLCQKVRTHECVRHGSRHVSSLVTKLALSVFVAVWIRESGLGPPHTRTSQ